MNAARPPSPSAPPPPTTTAQPSATRGGPALSADELAELRPHVITLEDGRLAPGASAAATSVGDFRSTADDIDAIFATHLPAFIAANAPGPVPIRALRARRARRQGGGLRHRHAADRVVEGERRLPHPLRVGDGTRHRALGRAAAVGVRRPSRLGRRGEGHVPRGRRAAPRRRRDLERHEGRRGRSIREGRRRARIRARPRQVDDRAPRRGPGARRGPQRRVDLPLAPAAGRARGGCPRDRVAQPARARGARRHVHEARAPATRRAARSRGSPIFTMDDDAERADTCLRIYNKSLLYLVSASFEPQKATPILGMAKFLTRDADLADFFTGASAEGDLVLAPNAVGLRVASAATFARRLRRRRADHGERRAPRRGRQRRHPVPDRGGRAPSSRGPSTRTSRPPTDRAPSMVAPAAGCAACALHRRRRVPRRGRPPAGLRRRRARVGRGVPRGSGST